MDWNWTRIGAIAGVVSCVIAAIMLALMVWPLRPGQPPPVSGGPQMMGWAPIILLAASVLLAGVLHLKAAQLSRSDRPLSQVTRLASIDSSQRKPDQRKLEVNDDRVFLDKSVIELERPFSGDLTVHKAQLLVADYLKKWVRWNLRVSDVTPTVQEMTRVTAHIPKEPGLGVFVNMYFSASERDKVIHLEKGAMIEVEGRIEEISMLTVNLVDCRLV